jgi:tRNA nucleotidyltransferase/poly(A) polymerase
MNKLFLPTSLFSTLINQDNFFYSYNAFRDLLIGESPVDLDLATTVTPQEMKHMFKAEGVHIFSTTGEKHGTITVQINGTKTFEVLPINMHVNCTCQFYCRNFFHSDLE